MVNRFGFKAANGQPPSFPSHMPAGIGRALMDAAVRW